MRLKFFMRKSWKGYCHSQLTDVEKVSIDKYKMDHCFGHCQNHCFPNSTCCFPFIAIQVMFVNGFILVFSISILGRSMLPEMVLFSLCHLVCQEHALFMFYHFQNDISKGLCFSTTGVLAWLEFVSKQVYCLVCVHFRQNIPFGQECLSFCLRSNASCSNCCFKEHYKKISLKGCQSSRFTQTRANTTTKSTADGLFDFLKRTKANIVQTFIFAMNWRRRRTCSLELQIFRQNLYVDLIM